MRQQVLGRFRTHWDAALVVIIVLGASWFRLTAYGDIRLSIATLDTDSYMTASVVPLWSWQAFTGERLFGTNLLYQLGGAQNCPVQALSVPAVGKEAHRQDQVCFEGVVTIQTALSILGWGLLVFAFALNMTSKLARISAAAILSVFAFVPQIADWDSILNSQSLAFSLLAMSLGFMLLVMRQMRWRSGNAQLPRSGYAFAAASLLTLALWSFVRDPNVYTVALLGVMLLVLGLLVRPRQLGAIAGAAAVLLICLVGVVSSMASNRWRVPLAGAYEQYVLGSPARLQELERIGMPDPSSAAYAGWFDNHAASSYGLLLLRHPRFVLSTVFDNLNYLFSDNNQPYFKTPDVPLRNVALQVGDWVHARSTSVILVAILSWLAILLAGVKGRSPAGLTWAWFLGWLLVSALATTALTFFADPAGVERHVLLSLVVLRLLMWMGLLVLIDMTQVPQSRAMA